jgi:pilus assembly protein Flp/PilA
MLKNIKRFFKNRSGASAVEYGLLVGLIAVTLTGGMGLLGTSINSAFAKPLDVLTISGSGGDSPGNVTPVAPVAPGKKVPGKLTNPGVSVAR